MGSRVKAFSVVSDAGHPGAQRLARSAKFWGWDHTFVIKQNQEDLDPPYRVWYPTYRAEQLGQLDFIRSSGAEFVFYLDGWDTVFTGPPQELKLERGKLTFCGDTVIHPDRKDLAGRFPEVGLECFRYVNAGVMWGDSQVMSELAADYLQNSSEGAVNQDYFNYRFLYEQATRGRKRLEIDHTAKVALNLMLLQKRFFEMDGVRPVFNVTGARPLVVHVPGHGSLPVVPLPKELEELYAER